MCLYAIKSPFDGFFFISKENLVTKKSCEFFLAALSLMSG